jgi:YebC/PmpR family DNA-binding regulatory protein
MSGHSKWATTKRAKGVTDSKRAAVFTRISKGITVAARDGGDPTMNFKLRLAIDQAKGVSMPKENIERAIKRGTGELKDGATIEAITYEGFGPGGIAIIVNTLTDNRNRTVGEIKHLFSKHGGNMGTPNSVSWMFETKGVLRVADLTDEQELAVIDAGAADVVRDADGVAIFTAPFDLQKVKAWLEQQTIEVLYAEVEQVAKEKVAVPADQLETFEKFCEILEDNEDVNEYFTNAA